MQWLFQRIPVPWPSMTTVNPITKLSDPLFHYNSIITVAGLLWKQFWVKQGGSNLFDKGMKELPILPFPSWSWRFAQVFRVCWWMGHFGHPSPKRHKAFTNNKWCEKYNLGRLKVHEFVADQKPEDKTAIKYKDKAGKLRYKGSGALKKSQSLSFQLIMHGTVFFAMPQEWFHFDPWGDLFIIKQLPNMLQRCFW